MSVQTSECRVLHQPATDALRFLPEGPYATTARNLSWVAIQHGGDATVGSVNVLDLKSGENTSFDLPGRPGFAFPTSKPGTYVCGVERELGLFDSHDGSWTVFCEGIDAEVENTIINDGVVFDGNLVFGCKHLEFNSRRAGLYLWRRADHQLIRLRDDQICSNGKAVISHESGGLTLIDIDSPSKQITRATLDIASGTLGQQHPIVDLSQEDVFPDGMIVTPDGRSLIVALYDPGDPDAGAARQYSLTTGILEAVWTCPASPRVTCPQLVELDGEVKLVLTTAVEGMEPERLRVHSAAGSLFIGDTNFSAPSAQPTFDLPL